MLTERKAYKLHSEKIGKTWHVLPRGGGCHLSEIRKAPVAAWNGAHKRAPIPKWPKRRPPTPNSRRRLPAGIPSSVGANRKHFERVWPCEGRDAGGKPSDATANTATSSRNSGETRKGRALAITRSPQGSHSQNSNAAWFSEEVAFDDASVQDDFRPKSMTSLPARSPHASRQTSPPRPYSFPTGKRIFAIPSE